MDLPDVRAVRQQLGMTKGAFSARFGFSLAALRHWERGERRPSGAALTLLHLIARQPVAVLRALREPIPASLRDRRRRWRAAPEKLPEAVSDSPLQAALQKIEQVKKDLQGTPLKTLFSRK